MEIVGLKIEKYIDKAISGHNCDFEYNDEEFERHILFGVLSDNRKVKIILSRSEGECYSGWCSASWGHIEVVEVSNFGGYTYAPIKKLSIEDIDPLNFDDNIKNEIFEVDYDGGDSYYPYGGYNVNMSLFKKTPRAKDKRPIWIFIGDSNVGKSYIASHLMDLSVYETDIEEELPEEIIADIIVLGNKYHFTIEEVKERLVGDCEVYLVNFNII